MSNKFITIKEAADMLGVSPLTLRNWDKSDKFKAMRHPINNYRVYRVEDIERFMESFDIKPTHTKTTPTKNKPQEPKRLKIKHLED